MRPGGTLSLKRRGYSSWAVVRGSRVRRAMASFMAGGLWFLAEGQTEAGCDLGDLVTSGEWEALSPGICNPRRRI